MTFIAGLAFLYTSPHLARGKEKRSRGNKEEEEEAMRIHGGNLVRALKLFKSSAPIIPGHPNQPQNLHSSITSLISNYFRSYSTPTGTFCIYIYIYFFFFGVKFCSVCRHLKTFENNRSAAAATSAVGRPR